MLVCMLICLIGRMLVCLLVCMLCMLVCMLVCIYVYMYVCMYLIEFGKCEHNDMARLPKSITNGVTNLEVGNYSERLLDHLCSVFCRAEFGSLLCKVMQN